MPVPAIDLHADDFALFGLPRRFALDRAELDQRRQQLLRLAHPDRCAAAGAAAQRIAMQWAVRINQGWQRLRDPLARAAYWCQLHGHDLQAHSNSAMPLDFLQQQMHWRETLAEAHAAADLAPLRAALAAERKQRLQALEQAIDASADAAAAAQQVRALLFIERLEQQVEDRLERWQTP